VTSHISCARDATSQWLTAVDPSIEAKMAGAPSVDGNPGGGQRGEGGVDRLEGLLGGLGDALRVDEEAQEGLEALLGSLVRLSQVRLMAHSKHYRHDALLSQILKLIFIFRTEASGGENRKY
jgi:hypothetical protein